MGIVRVRLEDLPPLTEEDIARLNESYEKFADKDVDDPDCPPSTKEQLERSLYLQKKYNTRIITKEMILEYNQMKAEGRL